MEKDKKKIDNIKNKLSLPKLKTKDKNVAMGCTCARCDAGTTCSMRGSIACC